MSTIDIKVKLHNLGQISIAFQEMQAINQARKTQQTLIII